MKKNFFLFFAIAPLLLSSCSIIKKHAHTYNKWESDGREHYHICLGCGIIIDREEHIFDNGLVTVQPTEQAEGIRTYTCTICEKTKQVEIPRIEHVHKYDQKNIEDRFLKSKADCYSSAIYYYSCSCGDIGKETFSYGDPRGHLFGESYEYNSSYHWHKAICEHTDATSNKEQHSFVDTIIKQPSLAEEGLKHSTCICGLEQEIVIPKLEMYEVNFYAYNDEGVKYLIKNEKVISGTSATPPAVPERDGYRFDGWDSSYQYVTKDINIDAKYVKQYCVYYVDYDGSLLKQEFADEGGRVVVSYIPERKDYKFNYFADSDGYEVTMINSLTKDVTLQAVYSKEYKVRFIDANGEIISSQTIVDGSEIVEPNHPNKGKLFNGNSYEGYEFAGWDVDFSNINSNTDIKAIYKKSICKVTYQMPNGEIIKSENYLFGEEIRNIDVPEYYCDKQTNVLYSFTDWKLKTSNGLIDLTNEKVDKDLTLVAEYNDSFNTPAVIVNKISDILLGIYLYIPQDIGLYSIDLRMKYNISITEVEENSNPGSLKSYGDKYQFDQNDLNKSLNIAWADGSGKEFISLKLIMVSTNLKNITLNEKILQFDFAQFVLSNNGVDFTKVEPLIIYC